MDWTGGARRRFAQREDTVVQKQRAHFASVRAAQNAAQERQPEPRGAAIGKQPIANLDAEAGLIRSHTQAAYVATRQQAGPTTCPSAEDELLLIQRRRLLAKPDWPGIATARPVRMRFPSVAEKDRIGKRRRVESKPMEDAAQTPSSAMFMSEVDSTVNFKVGTEALKSQTVTMPKSTVVGTSLRHMSGPVIGPSSLYLKRAQEADLPSISRRSPVDHLSDMPTSHRNVSSDLESISEESMLLGDDGDQSELNLKKMSLVQSAAPQVPQMFSHHGTTSMPFEWSSTIHDAVEDKPLRHFQNEEEHGELSALLKSKAGIVHPSPELSIEEVIAARGLNDQTRRIENWRHKSCTQLGISAICRYSGSPSKFDQDRADLHLEVADGISGSGARRTREEQAVHNPSGTRGNDTHTLSTPHIPRTTANCNVANPSENPTISQRCHNLAPSTSAVSHFHIRVGESGLHEQSRCMIDLRAENGTFNLLRATNKTPMELSVHSKEEEPRRRPLGVRDYPNTVQYGADGFSTLPQNELDMVDDSKSRMSTAERQPEGPLMPDTTMA
ncbi:hypothetical protein K470DRAFT_259251 [Piedraia hortae CBS 480.64]|uniref:Uncharacterized protein n=1 Tax=Piedraia hortae CBS 480.64 TaxID=1314780 RepID=A0A6A7BUS5_9PEZI|nr:hypothetical protein K470DRAFT_259251 [Piedraia hortae CBS 480.64]